MKDDGETDGAKGNPGVEAPWPAASVSSGRSSSPYTQLQTSVERDRWILEHRGLRNSLDPRRPYAFVAEQEAGPHGVPVDVATLFLTNRECPFRCLMCDLWQNTLEETVPPGAMAAQIRHALDRLPATDGTPRHLKLYNAGSFSDPRAIPPAEYPEIAQLCAPFERVIVECHPAFIDDRLLRFHDLLKSQPRLIPHPQSKPPLLPPELNAQRSTLNASPLTPNPQPLTPSLEVAIGLETAHPEVLARLNKRMTLDRFRQAADFLRDAGIALRVFILVRPPWLSEAEGLEWAKRSLDFAFECGAAVCSLIPTRAGNGAMEALAAGGEWAPPTLATLEAALDYGLGLQAGRVFADLWDIERFAACAVCAHTRIERLQRINRSQESTLPYDCRYCK